MPPAEPNDPPPPRRSRWERLKSWVVYGNVGAGLRPYYSKKKPPSGEERYEFALTYAAEECRRHGRVARRMQSAHVIFQALSIAAAAAATVLAVKPPEASDWIAAVPAALATFAAAALATFRFERHWLRHRRAATGIGAERALFVGCAGEYERESEGDPMSATTRFIAQINRISREGEEDVEEQAATK